MTVGGADGIISGSAGLTAKSLARVVSVGSKGLWHERGQIARDDMRRAECHIPDKDGGRAIGEVSARGMSLHLT